MLKQSFPKPRHLARNSLTLCIASALGACGGLSSETSPLPPPANSAPIIAGTPPTSAAAGQTYSFTPTASDPDGDPLTFSVSNQPSWATFSAANGSLTGTPTSNDSGPYPNVLISVSDGQLNASLPAFSIDVASLPTNSVQLSWTPPTLSADGSPLNDLRGYRIRWGTQTGSYPNFMEVNDPNADNSTVNNLADATYFFVVSAVDVSGNESSFSNEVSIAVP